MRWTDSFFLKCLPVFIVLAGLWLFFGHVSNMTTYGGFGWVIISVIYLFPIMAAVLLIGFLIDLIRFFEKRNNQPSPKSSKFSKIILLIVLIILVILIYRLYPHLFF